MSNPRFSLHLPIEERKALRIAAACVDMNMTDFIRIAIKEKIGREQAAASLHAAGADSNEAAALAKASEKPAFPLD